MKMKDIREWAHELADQIDDLEPGYDDQERLFEVVADLAKMVRELRAQTPTVEPRN